MEEIKSKGKTVKQVSMNKYLAFDKSIHQTMAEFNKTRGSHDKTLQDLFNGLENNWVNEGYESWFEEQKFKYRARKMLASYFCCPLDSGNENLIIDKVISRNIDRKTMLFSKVDKVYEKKDGSIEIIDYKSGYVVNHANNFPLYLRSSVLLLLTYWKLEILPSFISYYYLRYNKKLTHYVLPEDIDAATYIVNKKLLKKRFTIIQPQET